MNIDESFHENFYGNRLNLLVGWNRLSRLILCSSFNSRDTVPGGVNVATGSDGTTKAQQPAWLNLTPLAQLPSLKLIRIVGGVLEVEAFEDLAQIKTLEHVELCYCEFDGDHIARLSGLPNLQRLGIGDTYPVVKIRAVRVRDGKLEKVGPAAFEFVPRRFLDAPWSPAKFPAKEYDQWIESVLPGVQVFRL